MEMIARNEKDQCEQCGEQLPEKRINEILCRQCLYYGLAFQNYERLQNFMRVA